MGILRTLWDKSKPAGSAWPTIVTYLEMYEPPAQLAPTVFPAPLRFLHQPKPSLAFYRQLYDEVGRQWHWVSRRMSSDAALGRMIHAPSTDIFVLWDKTIALGFLEIDLAPMPTADIMFLGLIESAIGRGLGRQMLTSGLAHIWTKRVHTIRIQTCTLDHPSALHLYKQMGFQVVRTKHTVIYDTA